MDRTRSRCSFTFSRQILADHFLFNKCKHVAIDSFDFYTLKACCFTLLVTLIILIVYKTEHDTVII